MRFNYLNGLLYLVFLLFLSVTSAMAYEKFPAEFLFEIKEAGGSPFNQPTDIAIANNRLYVLDGMNHRVVVFDLDGRYLLQFGRSELKRPIGLCTDRGGRVYVANADTASVNIYSAEGEFLRGFTVTPIKGEEKPDITDCAVSEKGEIFLVDNDNHHVQVYSQEGRRLRWWGSFGENDKEFRYPATIGIDERGIVYVVDVINNKVKGFKPSGDLYLWIGGWGITPGKLFRPKGVLVSANRVFVSDSYTGVIQVFDTFGVFDGLLTTGTGEKLRLKTPTNMALSGNRLYVVEQLKNRISVWKLGR